MPDDPTPGRSQSRSGTGGDSGMQSAGAETTATRTDMADRLVYKLCTAGEWAAAVASGRFEGSADDKRDGYIHLSTAAQLPGTAGKYFRGIGDLVLVAVDTERLGRALWWEPSRGGDLFPHLYAALDTASACWVKPVALEADGTPILPGELDGC